MTYSCSIVGLRLGWHGTIFWPDNEVTWAWCAPKVDMRRWLSSRLHKDSGTFLTSGGLIHFWKKQPTTSSMGVIPQQS